MCVVTVRTYVRTYVCRLKERYGTSVRICGKPRYSTYKAREPTVGCCYGVKCLWYPIQVNEMFWGAKYI